jgi:prepilin-type N-terminal cleavage/methylation domain-containing protein
MAQNYNKIFARKDKNRRTFGMGSIFSAGSTTNHEQCRATRYDAVGHRPQIPLLGSSEPMTYYHNEPHQRGMTLVELLVVIAIIGITATVFGLQFLKYAPTYELRSNARTLFAEFQNAKIGAIRSGRNWGIVCNEGTSVCDVYSSDGADDDFRTLGDNVLFKSIDLKTSEYEIRIGHGSATSAVGGGAIGADNVTYAANILIFNNRGISNAGVVYIQNQKQEAYAIGTNIFGNIFLRRWDESGWN